jgi:NAD(P)-dependent dehydrogenase (short-subunit alcohol dehydrogenase family)
VRFSGRSVLVTGGAGPGLGLAIAQRFASEGARLAIVDRHEGRTDAAVERLRAEFGAEAAAGFAIDVASREAVAAKFPAIERFLDGADVLVNNAATNALGPPSEIADADWDRVLALNLTACFTLIRAVLPGMQQRRQGAIVNVSSIASLGHGAGNNAPYASSKAGLNAMTRSVAVSAGPYGVRCNAVAPGLIEGPFLDERREQFQEQLERTPLRRFAQPADVAAVIAFLASDDARHVTGEVVNVSGGIYMRP